MNGYEPTDKDIEIAKQLISERNPELTTDENAKDLLFNMQDQVRDGLRQVGQIDPDSLDKILEKLERQNS